MTKDQFRALTSAQRALQREFWERSTGTKGFPRRGFGAGWRGRQLCKSSIIHWRADYTRRYNIQKQKAPLGGFFCLLIAQQ